MDKIKEMVKRKSISTEVDVHSSSEMIRPELSHISAMAYHDESGLLAEARYTLHPETKGRKEVSSILSLSDPIH